MLLIVLCCVVHLSRSKAHGQISGARLSSVVQVHFSATDCVKLYIEGGRTQFARALQILFLMLLSAR